MNYREHLVELIMSLDDKMCERIYHLVRGMLGRH